MGRKSQGIELPVMPDMCKSCPFREDGKGVPLHPEYLGKIQTYLIKGVNHKCHAAQLAGKPPSHTCRGGRNFQLMIWYRLGWISAPTDEALATERKRVSDAKTANAQPIP